MSTDRHFHTRLINLTYCDQDLPKFETQEQVDAWYKALGRMVAYGMNAEHTDDTVQLVVGGINKNPQEIVLSYHHPLTPLRDEEGCLRYTDSADQIVNDAIKALVKKTEYRPFVIGAVLHSDGKWGFHS